MAGSCIKYVAVSAALIFSNVAWANSIQDTHRFRLGVYEQDVDITASATRAPLPEVEVDFDGLLGVDDSSTTKFLSYQWRYAERWSLAAFYSQMEADGKKTASRDFNFNGQEFTIGARLDSEFNLDTYLVSVNYSLVLDSKKEFGLGLGLHAFDIETTIAAAAGTNGVVRTDTRTTGEVLAPLPNLRAYGTYLFTDRWEVSGQVGWLSLDYEDYEGDYLFLVAFTEYRITKNFGMGVSYQIAEIDVVEDSSKTRKEFDLDFHGPSIYLTWGF